jgi:hypothetical protein
MGLLVPGRLSLAYQVMPKVLSALDFGMRETRQVRGEGVLNDSVAVSVVWGTYDLFARMMSAQNLRDVFGPSAVTTMTVCAVTGNHLQLLNGIYGIYIADSAWMAVFCVSFFLGMHAKDRAAEFTADGTDDKHTEGERASKQELSRILSLHSSPCQLTEPDYALKNGMGANNNPLLIAAEGKQQATTGRNDPRDRVNDEWLICI